MDCSEFLSRFSDFYDSPPESRLRQRMEAHVEQCETCARYGRVVARGAALLQTLPRIELSESFRTKLEHRLFHVKDEKSLARIAVGSAVPVLTAVGMAVILAVIAWAPTLGRSAAKVDLPPIVVYEPPSGNPPFLVGVGAFTPQPGLDLAKGLWSDPTMLLYEYSPMRARYQTEGLLRRTGLD